MFLIWRKKVDKNPPPYFVLVILIAIVCGILWNKFLAEILVDCLEAIHCVFDIPNDFLGISIIAVGNALPDGMTIISLAKLNESNLAIISSFSSNLFTILVGLGVSIIKRHFSK